MNEKRNLNWCMESMEKQAFERGKRAGQNEHNKVLDKIKAEIEHMACRQYEYKLTLDREDVLQIIDKYRKESEE